MFSFTAFLISVVAINLVACGNGTIESKDIKSTSVFRSYTVERNLDEENLEAYARFSAGGPNETSVFLNDPSMVLVNSQRLQVHDGRTRSVNINGTYYQHTFSTMSDTNYAEFTWYDDEMNKTVDVVALPETFFFKNLNDKQSINSTNELKINLQTSSLREGEKWELSLSSDTELAEQDEMDRHIFESFSDDSIVISSEKLQNFAKGGAKLSLSRVKVTRKQENDKNAGALIRAKATRSIQVEID